MKHENILFLTLAEVIEIHADQINRYGGEKGIRDISLLSSALAMPRATFDGVYLHNDIYDMAAAYAFHISQNHPFIDGNKRTALVAALVFLEFNGIEVNDPHGLLYKTMMKLAAGRLRKEELAAVLKTLSKHGQ
jgi:death-on-curing protein